MVILIDLRPAQARTKGSQNTEGAGRREAELTVDAVLQILAS